jgi:hypothetical protein
MNAHNKKTCMRFVKVSKGNQLTILIKRTNKLLDEWKVANQCQKRCKMIRW